MNTNFELFGPIHQIIILSTFALPILLVTATRLIKANLFVNVVLFLLVTVLVCNRIWAVIVAWNSGLRSFTDYLPLHLCDVAFFMVVVASISQHPELIRVTYFFALGGTLQAIFTPDINVNFPHPRFISFFISHCGIVVCALFLTFGLKTYPTWQSLIRAFVWLQIYAAIVIMVNFSLGTNFGYLARKPLQPSLLDYFGPWPWYILVLEVAALVVFVLLMLPFTLKRALGRALSTQVERLPMLLIGL